MSGFWSSLFGGANSNLSNDISQTSQIGDFATGMGESNLTAGSNFQKALLSGDATKTSQALAPQISALNTKTANQNKTNAEFGTRSGGNAASANASNDANHADITNLIGSLTGGAASGLMSSGGSLLSQGASSYGQNAQLSQEQMQNWSNSIFGLGGTKVAGYGEGALLSALGGGSSGGGGS